MSIKFDKKTGNLLEPSTVGRRLTFISITGEVYPATDEDTLIYQEDSITTSLTQHDNLFKNALEDPTNPRKIKYCQKVFSDIFIRSLAKNFLKDRVKILSASCKNFE